MIRKKTVKMRGLKYPTIFVEGTDTLYLDVNGVKVAIYARQGEKQKEVIELEVGQGTAWIFDQPLVVEAHRTHFRLRKHPRTAEYCPMCGNEEPKKVLQTPGNSKLLQCPGCNSVWYESPGGEKTPIHRSDASPTESSHETLSRNG